MVRVYLEVIQQKVKVNMGREPILWHDKHFASNKTPLKCYRYQGHILFGFSSSRSHCWHHIEHNARGRLWHRGLVRIKYSYKLNDQSMLHTQFLIVGIIILHIIIIIVAIIITSPSPCSLLLYYYYHCDYLYYFHYFSNYQYNYNHNDYYNYFITIMIIILSYHSM